MNSRIGLSAILTTALLFATSPSQARWMNPQTARFHTMDTYEGDKEQPLSLHKYVYCRGNPVNLTDPTGLEVAVYSHIVVWPWSHANVRLYPDNTNNIPSGLLANANPQALGWQVAPDGRLYVVIGAGNDDNFSRLTTHLNRRRDLARPQNGNRFDFLVDPTSGLSNDQFIVRVLQAEQIYGDTANLGYFTFPAISEYDYNSNSYVIGLLNAVTGRNYSARLNRIAPGKRKPVPSMWFEPVPGVEVGGLP